MKFKAAEGKQDASPIVFERAKAPSGTLERLNGAVERLGHRVCNLAPEVGQKPVQMVLEGFSHLLDRPAPLRLVIPLGEKLLCRLNVRLPPKLEEQQPVVVRTRRP